MDWTLRPGEAVSRSDVHDRYGGVRQGGISPSSTSPNVLLFTDDAANRQHGYLRDHWNGTDLFLYCGEGQVGHQTLTRYNGSVLHHRTDGKALRLFQGVRGTVKYVAELYVDPDEPFHWRWGPGRDGTHRRVVMFQLRPVGQETAPQQPVGSLADERPYVPADEQAATTRDRAPALVDPDSVDRGLQGHATTQNLLAEALLAQGLHPLSPGPGQPAFDLAWRISDRLYVAEVKSLIVVNELHQVRLGIGQVLDYAHSLDAVPALALERRPQDPRWSALCAQLGIALLWPSRFHDYLQRQTERADVC